MRLAHVSDLHLGLEGAAGDPRDVAQAVVEDLKGISEALDLVVVSGDLTEKADPGSFDDFVQLFSAIGVPVAIVPGNHDGPAGMHAFGRTSKIFDDWHITNRVIEVSGVRLLGLDTCIEAATQGALDEDGLGLLEQEVARQDAGRLVVVMHHPPLLLGLAQFDGFCRLEGRDRFLQIMGAAHEQVIVLSGHVHRPFVANNGQVSCCVAGSMVAPYDSALPFGDLPIRPAALQDFYFVHDIAPGAHHVVTSQRVRGLAR